MKKTDKDDCSDVHYDDLQFHTFAKQAARFQLS